MHGSALAEEGRAQIFFYRKLVERSPGEGIRAFHGAFGVVTMKAEDILEG
jgi:hypothetical protein